MIWLVICDAIVLALVTASGFASHNELGSASLPRMLTTFFPLVIAWFLIGPFVGVYNLSRVSDPRHLWRPFWAMVLAGPMAGWLRGVLLGAPIIPLFVVVLGGVAALAMLAWRVIYWLLIARRDWING